MSVESPCIGVCRLDTTKAFCIGCHRSVSEIAAWSCLSDADKLRVLVAVQKRKSTIWTVIRDQVPGVEMSGPDEPQCG